MGHLLEKLRSFLHGSVVFCQVAKPAAVVAGKNGGDLNSRAEREREPTGTLKKLR